ncbi:hypothetical protein BDV25DRAFT_166462 [Aspergillus avenaceus]|uniref:Uncharacterized protein n=1 Tax=Aspergillus avenaceus TaxID=36643 RepID=A0A5N6TE87_ASPAV|nr:hypothetical protein BDV25DRAFT_166462 [Aspergillus avenaceus]
MSISASQACLFCGRGSNKNPSLATHTRGFDCSQCGQSGYGDNLEMQEDLAACFAKQLSMDINPSFSTQRVSPSAPAPITYSITQHYHHSSHVAHRAFPEESSKQGASSSTISSRNSIYEILKHHNIDPLSLASTQLRLFEDALPEQRSRLIQIWQICPASSTISNALQRDHPGLDMDMYASDSTGNKGNSSESAQANDFEMSDSVRYGDSDEGQEYAEPYMISGYAMLTPKGYELSSRKVAPIVAEPTTGSPYNLAGDPIYGVTSQHWWEHSQQEALQVQYGACEEMNRYAGCSIVRPSWLS